MSTTDAERAAGTRADAWTEESTAPRRRRAADYIGAARSWGISCACCASTRIPDRGILDPAPPCAASNSTGSVRVCWRICRERNAR
jgi:hypothetical protein